MLFTLMDSQLKHISLSSETVGTQYKTQHTTHNQFILGNTLNQVKSVTLECWVASCYQSLVNKSINMMIIIVVMLLLRSSYMVMMMMVMMMMMMLIKSEEGVNKLTNGQLVY